MIVGEQKSIKEILEMTVSYDNLLLLGCGTCVKTCFAGGEDETAALASVLRLASRKDGRTCHIEEFTVERQCEDAFIVEAAEEVARSEAVLSLACGAGVQAVARRFPDVRVLPGINTTFIGVLERRGVFTEECSGCGDCQLAVFGGVCPFSRCAKKLLNGPCGGSKNGQCEVDSDTACAWHLIIERLAAWGRLNALRTYVPPKNWRSSLSGGPRKLIREDHIL